MIPSNKKIERMIQIARLYYEEDMTQHLIAQKLGISRPLVSQLLTEAKSCGIVTIRINEIENREALLRHQLVDRFGLEGAIVVPDDSLAADTDRAIASAAYQFCFLPDSAGKNVGVGCGPILGLMADLADSMPTRPQHGGHIFPLIGGFSKGERGDHANELVRIFAGKAGFDGDYLYAPAAFDSEMELSIARDMGASRTVTQMWNQMDMAIINPSDFPSPLFESRLHPDGSNPAGQILGHCYSLQGEQLNGGSDTILQASMSQLRAARQVVALCSSELSPDAVRGALELDLINTLILPVSLAQAILNR